MESLVDKLPGRNLHSVELAADRAPQTEEAHGPAVEKRSMVDNGAASAVWVINQRQKVQDQSNSNASDDGHDRDIHQAHPSMDESRWGRGPDSLKTGSEIYDPNTYPLGRSAKARFPSRQAIFRRHENTTVKSQQRLSGGAERGQEGRGIRGMNDQRSRKNLHRVLTLYPVRQSLAISKGRSTVLGSTWAWSVGLKRRILKEMTQRSSS